MVLTRYHLENWKANANEQIDYDNATIFRGCGHHSFRGSNLIEATVDAKGGSRNCDVEACLNMGYCFMIQRTSSSTGNIIESLPMSE
jgi:hypothetical protein